MKEGALYNKRTEILCEEFFTYVNEREILREGREGFCVKEERGVFM